MGSSCAGQNRTLSSTSFQTVKSNPIQNGHGSFKTVSDETEKHKEAEMEKKSDTGQAKSAGQQNNKEIDKADEIGHDDDIDKDKEETGDDKEMEDDDDEEEKKKKQEPLTEGELREFKENKYKDLRSTAEEVFALETFQNEDGEYVKLIRNAGVRFYNSYYALKRAAVDEIVKYRLGCAKIMIETKFVDLCCDIIIYTHTHGWYSEDGKKNELKFAPLSKCFVTIVNFTDCSDELTIYLSNKKEFLEVHRKVLLDYHDRHFGKAEPQLKPTEEKVLYAVISILHNLSMRETNTGPLRSHDFVSALQPYLESSKAMYRLNVLASLAGIINEEECEIINANKSSVAFLLKVLGNCLTDKRRRNRGWSAKESGLAVRTLARNDANKKLLVELGALELLVELGKTGNTAEQYESIAAIWALCFDTDNRALVTGKPELAVVELLLDLKKESDPEIKKVCNGALWTLRDDLRNSAVEKYKQIGEQLFQQHERHKNELAQKGESERSRKDAGGHVMISYQWANQEMLKTIRDRLKGHGFKLWMDIDQMGGSTLQAMADAVEGADVFLMCMSNKYKNSPACRAEAEYAFQTRKKIIPLKMEAGYNADGWLGFILGAKLFFDFSGKYPFENKMVDLLKELDSAMKNVHEKEGKVDRPSVPAVTAAPGPHSSQVSNTSSAAVGKTSAKTSVAMETLSNVRNWGTEQVNNWVETNDLKACGLAGMTGSEIAYLAKMQTDAPEFFHKFLFDTLKAKNVTTIAKIGWALHDLSVGRHS